METAASDIARLKAALPHMTPAERERALVILKARVRGFRSNRYIDALRPNLFPNHPRDNPRQRAFLGLGCLEAFYGGSGGGGKTEALLLAALQYVDEPKYSAVLIMDTFTNLEGPGALLHRAREWLCGAFPEIQFSAKNYAFRFPTHWLPRHVARRRAILESEGQDTSGISDDELLRRMGSPPSAEVSFAYLQHADDKYKFKSKEFQFVAFDELSAQGREEDYAYLFSRLRRLEWSDVPLRMRSASNPGGKGHLWVRDRFIPDEYLRSDVETQFGRTYWENAKPCGECAGTSILLRDGQDAPCFYCEGSGSVSATFVPARARDNKSLDVQSYMIALSKMTPLERARMEHGDWNAVEEGDLFRSDWLRYYFRRGEHFLLPGKDAGGKEELFDQQQIIRFLTVDTASTDKNYSDFTAIASWAMHRTSRQLFLLNVTRAKLLIPDILPAIRLDFERFSGQAVILEDKASGIAVIQEARRRDGGLPVVGYNPGRSGKVERATTASAMMANGKIALPSGPSPRWLTEFVAEILSFPNGVYDDQVDTLSMAAWYASQKSTGFGTTPAQAIRPAWHLGRAA